MKRHLAYSARRGGHVSAKPRSLALPLRSSRAGARNIFRAPSSILTEVLTARCDFGSFCCNVDLGKKAFAMQGLESFDECDSRGGWMLFWRERDKQRPPNRWLDEAI